MRTATSRSTVALGAGMALVCCYLVQRMLGLYPGIFVDEWYYSEMARLAPLSEAILPSYLYLLVFGHVLDGRVLVYDRAGTLMGQTVLQP